jgi:type II secretory pathway pseudopilin PulG
MIKRLKQTGDTIVEVLIAMAVISLVLAGAFTTANRSSHNVRQAQERSEAIKYSEQQLEQLKALVKSNPSAVFSLTTQTTLFCTSSTGLVPFTTGTLPARDSDTFSIYPANCKAGNIPGSYNLSIIRVGTNDFRVVARWNNAIGTGNDEITMWYRLYQ